MKNYNVLWIDDEVEKQDAFIDAASLEGINLIPFRTNKAGIEALQRGVDDFDAIVLDAKGYELSEEERAGFTGLQNSIKAINALPKKIPYFIFSGYLDKDEYGMAREMLNNEEILTKGKDNQRLFDRIKERSDNQIDTQIRHENKALFNALESYGADSKRTVLQIFRALKTGDAELSDHLYFTPLRMILEQMFRKANNAGLLHDACVTVNGSNVNLTESSLFMSGLDTRHLKVRCTKTHFPKIIAEAVKNVLFITGAASHTSEVDVENNINVQAYREDLKTPYLLFHLTYMMADILIWFENYSAKNTDANKNKGYWRTIEFEEDAKNEEKDGEIINMSSNDWITLKDLNSDEEISFPSHVVEHDDLLKIKIGSKVWYKLKPNQKPGVRKYLDRVRIKEESSATFS